MSHYILDNHKVVAVDLMTWANWFQSRDNRRVRNDTIGGVRVSTVFLGLDHQCGEGPPLLFETMIFGGAHDEFQERCSTWEQAEEMHKRALRMVQEEAR